MSFRNFVLATVAAVGVASAAHADDAFTFKHKGLLMLNVRVTDVIPTDGQAIVTAGGAPSGLNTRISDSVIPSIGITYFLTDNVAAELIAGTSRHTIEAVNATTDIPVRKTWVLPPTLSLQYHLMPHSRFSPYLGAGVNYMYFYPGHDMNGFTVRLSNGFGVSLQAGADYAINDHLSLNVDVKKLFFQTTAKINGGALTSKVNLDPWVPSVGFGYRF